MTRSRQTADWGSRAGLAKVIPSSITVTGSGATGSASTTGSVTFSSCTSVSLLNVFSSNYKVYFVWLSAYASTTSVDIQLRLGVNASFDTGLNYSYGFNTVTRSNSQSSIAGNAVTQWTIGTANNSSTDQSFNNMYIFNPNQAIETGITFQGWNRLDNRSGSGAGFHDLNTAYTDLYLLPSTGNMTGSISVYGITE